MCNTQIIHSLLVHMSNALENSLEVSYKAKYVSYNPEIVLLATYFGYMKSYVMFTQNPAH